MQKERDSLVCDERPWSDDKKIIRKFPSYTFSLLLCFLNYPNIIIKRENNNIKVSNLRRITRKEEIESIGRDCSLLRDWKAYAHRDTRQCRQRGWWWKSGKQIIINTSWECFLCCCHASLQFHHLHRIHLVTHFTVRKKVLKQAPT